MASTLIVILSLGIFHQPVLPKAILTFQQRIGMSISSRNITEGGLYLLFSLTNLQAGVADDPMHAHLCVLNGTWLMDAPALGWVPNHLVLCMDGLRRGSGCGNDRRWAWVGRCMTAPVWSRWLAREVQVRKAGHPCAVRTKSYCTPALAAATAAAAVAAEQGQSQPVPLML